MEDHVVCPNCGELNSPELPYCQHCQWRLKPLDADWESERPGSAPESEYSEMAPPDVVPEVPAWLRDPAAILARHSAPTIKPATEPPKPSAPAEEDLLAGLARQSTSEEEQVPDWIARVMGIVEEGSTGSAQSPAAQPPSQPDPHRPDLWQTATEPPISPSQAPTKDVELWPPDAGEPSAPPAPPKPAHEDEEVHEWLRKLDATSSRASEDRPSQRPLPATTDVPTWVGRMRGIAPVDPSKRSREEDASVPDWLRDAGSRTEAAPGPEQSSPRSVPPFGRPEPPPTVEPPPSPGAQRSEPRASTPRGVPAFVPDSADHFDVDAVFASMEMPDWLSDITPQEETPKTAAGESAEDTDSIGPAELPGWVQAMRPTAPPHSEAPARRPSGPLEQTGPLLGLQGVLPSVPGAAIPSIKPRPHAIRLEASEQHAAHARALDEMLEAERKPVPLKGVRLPGPERVLRWSIGGLLIAAISTALLTQSAAFPLPQGSPTDAASSATRIVEGIPADSAVLAVFDYQPSTAGEMEAVAAPLMDHLLLLKHPHLALLSTSPTGSILAERLLRGPLSPRQYTRGTNYADLGYVAGGLAGVRLFADEPQTVLSQSSLAGSDEIAAVLPAVDQLSDFSAIIVLTDTLDGGRVWIEQTAAARGPTPIILVSSAGAGPVLLPYFSSGQVSAMVAGLYGAASTEISNGGLPGYVRRYWDAYSLSSYLAVVIMVLGIAWHVWRAFREGREEQL